MSNTLRTVVPAPWYSAVQFLKSSRTVLSFFVLLLTFQFGAPPANAQQATGLDVSWVNFGYGWIVRVRDVSQQPQPQSLFYYFCVSVSVQGDTNTNDLEQIRLQPYCAGGLPGGNNQFFFALSGTNSGTAYITDAFSGAVVATATIPGGGAGGGGGGGGGNQQGYQLEVFNGDGSKTNTAPLFKFQFDSSKSEFTAPSQHVKLGQLFTARIVPLNPDGTEGSPVSLTEVISGAVPDNLPISPIPTLSGARGTDLFFDKVLLHFPKSATAPQHQYFGIHGGSATLDLKFSSGSSSFTVHVPMQVVTCADSSFSCTPGLGAAPADFDQEIMFEADIRGIPPQLIKAQIGQESRFDPNAYRYEALSIDYAAVGRSSAQLKDTRLAPWRLATSRDCSHTVLAQGTSLNLQTTNATSRSRFQIQLDGSSVPLCHVTATGQGASARNIAPADALVSMENILFTNDATGYGSWMRINNSSFADFQTYQANGGKPFTAQTVIAASYGLHQVLYTTATQQMGYTDANGEGLPPAGLLNPSISLFFGSEYLAEKYQYLRGPEDLDFDSLHDLFFRYGPALRAYNAGDKAQQLTFDQINAQCGTAPLPPPPPKGSGVRDLLKPFRYACGILNGQKANVSTYTPAPLNP
jgi:hypothetical protein